MPKPDSQSDGREPSRDAKAHARGDRTAGGIDLDFVADGGALLRTLLDDPRHVVMYADEKRHIRFANQCCRRLTGYSATELNATERNPLQFCSVDVLSQTRLSDALDRGETFHYQYSIASRDGQTLQLLVIVQPLLDPAGSIAGWIITGNDVTEHVRLREQFSAHAERLQITLESARMGTWEVNNQTGQVIVDDSWLQLAGLTQADRDQAGELWRQSIHEDDRERMDRRMDEAIVGSADVKSSQYRVVRQDGSIVWVQDTSRIVERDKEGLPVKLVGVVADITDMKLASIAAERSAERLWMATEVAGLGVWDHDMIEQRFFWSDRMREIYGMAPEDESLTAYADMTHPDDHDQAYKAVVSARDRGEHCEMQFRIIRSDGEVRYLEVFSKVHKTSDGRPHRAVGITRDVTEQVQLALERQNAQKLESIGRLAAGIAHEVNTPAHYVSENLRFIADAFNALEPLIELVRNPESTVDVGKMIDELRSDPRALFSVEEAPQAITESLYGMERIESIVKAMNTFSHPSNDRSLVDIKHAISSTVTVARSEWKQVAEVEIDIAEDVPDLTLVASEFNQAILNLIVNAAHAIADSSQGGRARVGTIRVSARQSGDCVEIAVADDGCGIPPDVQVKIFDPFYTTKPVGKGTGQGLSFVHGFVTGHAGAIDVESTVGKGTRFIMRLPIDSDTVARAAVTEAEA